jgi:hypothetical protein
MTTVTSTGTSNFTQEAHHAMVCIILIAVGFVLLLNRSTVAVPLHGHVSAYSAICVVARNENRYISEWVQYHKCLGREEALRGTQ